MKLRRLLASVLVFFLLLDEQARAEPQRVQSGSQTTWKFGGTIDSLLKDNCRNIPGSSGCERFSFATQIEDSAIEIWLQPSTCTFCNTYGSKGYFYFDNIKLYLTSITANQVISSRVVITSQRAQQAESAWQFRISDIMTQWTESNPASGVIGGFSNEIPSIRTLGDGEQISFNTTEAIKSHLNGVENYGFAVSVSSGKKSGIYFHTSEASDPNLRPFLEVVVDTSRPRFPAPTDSPQGLSIAASTSSVTASWTGIPVNTESVRVDINCSISGTTSNSVSATSRSITRTGLRPGERCSARAASINDGGSSPLSMSTSEVVVAGTAPSTAPTSRLSINSSQATVSVSGIASDATEVQVILTCTQSGQRNTTITASQPTATFTGLTTGESCSSYSVARNAWGSSPQGAVSNSELVRGQAPSSMSFISESPIANQLRISWASTPANTTTVDLVLSCQSTGRISRSLSPNDRQAVISDLRSGEQCTPSLTLTNQWGSSPTTTNPAVLIKGSAPLAPSISNIDLLTPQQVIVNYLVPSGATTIDLYLRCSQAGTNTLLNLPSSRTSATFTNAISGDRCSVSAQAKNEWGASSESSATSQFTIQGQRPDSPSSAEIKSDVEVVRLTWNNGSGATQTQITLECTKSGTRSFLINTPDRTHLVGAVGGELCSAVLISKNQWGESRNGIRTSSVVVESRPVTRPPGNTTIATPKPTNPIIKPAPKATTKAPVPKVEAPTSTGKKSSIICIKGGAQQAITAIKPKCPKGWIKKPEVVKKD